MARAPFSPFSFRLPTRNDGNSNNTSNSDADQWSHNSPSVSVNMPNIFPRAHVPMSPVTKIFQQRQTDMPTPTHSLMSPSTSLLNHNLESPMIPSTPRRNQNSSAPSNFHHLQQMVTDSDDDMESWEDRGVLLTQSMENISTWCNQKATKIAEVDAKYCELLKLNNGLKGQLQSARSEIEMLRNSNNQLKESQREFSAKVTEVSQKFNLVKGDLQQSNQLLHSVKNDQIEWKAYFEELKSDWSNRMLKQAKQESQEEIEQYRQRFQSLEGAHQLQITNLEEQLDHLRKQAGEIDENLCKMTDARNSFIEKLSVAEATIGLLENENASLKKDHEELKQEWSQLKNAFNDQLNERTVGMVLQLQSKREELEFTLEELDKVKKRIFRLEEELKEKNEESSQLKSQSAESGEMASSLRRQLDSLTKQICSSGEERAKMVQDKEILSTKVTTLQGELVAARNQMESSIQACGTAKNAISELTGQKVALSKEIVQLSSQLKEKDESLLEAAGQKVLHEKCIADLRRQLEEESESNAAINAAKMEKELELVQVSTQLVEAEHHFEVKCEQVKELTEANGQMAKQLEECVRERDDHGRRIAEMFDSKTKLENNLKELRESLVEKERVIIDRSIDVEYKTEKIAELEKTVTKLQSKSKKSELKSVTQLETMVREKEFAFNRIKHEMESLEAMVREKDLTISRLEQEKNSLEDKGKRSTEKIASELKTARDQLAASEDGRSKVESDADLMRSQLVVLEGEVEQLRKSITKPDGMAKPRKSMRLSLSLRPDDNEATGARFTANPLDDVDPIADPDNSVVDKKQQQQLLPGAKKFVTFKDPNVELGGRTLQVKVSPEGPGMSRQDTPAKPKARPLSTKKSVAEKRSQLDNIDHNITSPSPVFKSSNPRGYGRGRPNPKQWSTHGGLI